MELITLLTLFSSNEINTGLSGLVVGETIRIVLGEVAPLIMFLVLEKEEEMVFLFFAAFCVCLEAREMAEEAPLISLCVITVMVEDRG